MPAATARSVDLPEPFPPMSARTSPSATVRVAATQHPIGVAVVAKPRIRDADHLGRTRRTVLRRATAQHGHLGQALERDPLHHGGPPRERRTWHTPPWSRANAWPRPRWTPSSRFARKRSERKAFSATGSSIEGRLVEQEQTGSHGKRRGEREHLALTARELGARAMKPGLHAKEVAGLGHASPHLRLGEANVSQARRPSRATPCRTLSGCRDSGGHTPRAARTLRDRACARPSRAPRRCP